MAWRSGVPERVGYRGHFRGPLLRPALAHRAPARSVHLTREYLDLIDPELELDCYPPRLDLPGAWAAEQLARICRELPERFVAIAPGAVYGPAKAWPAERYRELARGLRDRAGVPVLLLGTSDEHALAEQVRNGEAGILNWCGTTDLPGLVAVLSRAALLVSNDSGAMHVMAALRRPQVAIFGSTSPAWTGPINAKASVVALGLPCAPCFARTCRYGHYDCLRRSRRTRCSRRRSRSSEVRRVERDESRATTTRAIRVRRGGARPPGRGPFDAASGSAGRSAPGGRRRARRPPPGCGASPPAGAARPARGCPRPPRAPRASGAAGAGR